MSSVQLNGTVKSPKAPAAKRDALTERTATETVARLQRGVLRLALAYQGQSASLDQQLKELGGLVRSGRRDSELQRLIDEIVSTIIGLGLQQVPPAAPSSAAAEQPDLLHHFFEHLAAPAAVLAQITEVRKRIAARGETSGLLGEVEQAAATLSAQLALAPDGQRFAESFRQGLLDLLDRVPISRQLASAAIQLRRAIEAAATVEDVRPCLNILADVVNKMRDELQGELVRLTEFLRVTARRLVEFEQVMTRSSELHAGTTTDALQLSDTVGCSVRDLRAEVRAADDLDEVKALIDSKLTTIDRVLAQFVAAQISRASEAGDVIERMNHRLKDLEQQAAHLRDDLEIQHARVLLDPLTGVLNRAGYTETVIKLFARWKRYGGALTLAVIDLDLFKDINDRYGHAAGDRVLATVATKLKEVLRESDVLCRYGGEEFVLLLPETTVTDARALLEKLRLHIEQCPFRHKDTPVRVTLSCGIAQFHASDTVEPVFERADQAMYRAKSGGRNCVRTEPDAPPPALPTLD